MGNAARAWIERAASPSVVAESHERLIRDISATAAITGDASGER